MHIEHPATTRKRAGTTGETHSPGRQRMDSKTTARIELLKQSPTEKPHGVRARYMHGCRCVPCRAANSRYATRRTLERLKGNHNGYQETTEARSHLLFLQKKGVGYRQVASNTGISPGIILQIRNGTRRNIRALNARRILAVTVAARGGRHDCSRRPDVETASVADRKRRVHENRAGQNAGLKSESPESPGTKGPSSDHHGEKGRTPVRPVQLAVPQKGSGQVEKRSLDKKPDETRGRRVNRRTRPEEIHRCKLVERDLPLPEPSYLSSPPITVSETENRTDCLRQELEARKHTHFRRQPRRHARAAEPARATPAPPPAETARTAAPA